MAILILSQCASSENSYDCSESNGFRIWGIVCVRMYIGLFRELTDQPVGRDVELRRGDGKFLSQASHDAESISDKKKLIQPSKFSILCQGELIFNDISLSQGTDQVG